MSSIATLTDAKLLVDWLQSSVAFSLWIDVDEFDETCKYAMTFYLVDDILYS